MTERLSGSVRSPREGIALAAAAAAALVAVSGPVLWRGAPLADDFNTCVATSRLGLGGFAAASWQQLGLIRPARFLEILLGAGVCESLPFGVAIAVPLLLTLAVAWQAHGLLRDLEVPPMWAGAGAALWLLQPLGTETALWPAALHVPLGLLFALVSLRLFRRDRLALGVLANAAAVLSVEQVIFPMPVAVWLIAARRSRGAAAAASAGVAFAALVAFSLWPGANPRLRVSLADRLAGLVADPTFYAAYPAVGLGLHSIPLAIQWALPWSVAVLAAGALAGRAAMPRLAAEASPTTRPAWLRTAAAVVVIVGLLNAVVVLAVPQQGSPRVFAPTWLTLALGTAVLGSRWSWPRPRLVGVAAGLFAAGAVLSLALSVHVRLASAAFTEVAARTIATRVAEGGRAAVCNVERTVVEPAPRGGYAVHDFLYEWAAEPAVTFYTGRHVTVLLAGPLWPQACPSDVDAVFDFAALRAASR